MIMLGYMVKAIQVADKVTFANQVTLGWESNLDYPGGLSVTTSSFYVERKTEEILREM